MDPRLLSGTAIARLIREGEVSSREVVDAHIAQIERVNPTINAVVADRFEAARREADEADRAIRETDGAELPPFHGVPCTIKENFALTGMPNASGLHARRHVVSDRDATAVARLRAAGCIPLGVTNTSELCMWMESNNFVYGRSNNPYDPTRLVGGSSGGEAAIIGAGGSPFGLGSDIGGSIRGPCFFNGVFGHKSTAGMVPSTGQFPLPDNEARRYLCTGPLARRAEDLLPLLRVLAGPDGEDPACEEMPLGDPSTVELSGRTVLHVPDNGRIPIRDDLREAQELAARTLERAGMRIRTRRFRYLDHQFDIWSALMAEQSETPFGTMLGEGTPIRPAWELVKFAFGRSKHTAIASLLALFDPVPKLFPERMRKLVRARDRLRDEILAELGDDGLLLYPTYSTPAPKHGVPVWRTLMLDMPFAYQGILNVLFLPATQVPLGLNADGLPLGVQVVSRELSDHVTIAAAMHLERELGGWVPPAIAGIP